ncbi:MAG TPA: zinc finger domain-containing protein [Myxococcales bacterium]
MKTAARAYREPGCPRCWEPLPRIVLKEGAVYCGNCALEFQAALFDPPESPRAAPRDLDGGTSAQCARHARNAAVAACERCGAFICSLCRVESDGKVLCAACFDRLRAEGALESARTTFRSWRTLGLYLSVGGIFVWPLGIVIGPAALVAAVRGISQDRKNGDEGGLPGSILSLLLGAVVTLMGIVLPLSMAGAFRR